MNIKRVGLVLFLFFVVFNAGAQNARSLESSKQVLEKLRNRETETQRLVDSLGIQRRYETERGVVEISHFVNGFPRFLFTNNLYAAQTTSTSVLWPGGSANLNLTGAGITLGIWDAGSVLNTHQEFGSRVTLKDGTATQSHSTHVAGTMIASGIDPLAHGMSPGANLDSYDWTSDAYEMFYAGQGGMQVSNHSYGWVTGWSYNYDGGSKWYWLGDTTLSRTKDFGFGAYTYDESYWWDYDAWWNPNYLIVKSAGNDRYEGPSSQPVSHYVYRAGTNDWTLSTTVRDIDGSTGYNCIPWNGVAKNILTVGAVYDIPGGYLNPAQVSLLNYSSTGPTDDGRIKPDLVANGTGLYSCNNVSTTSYSTKWGTSMAAPNVSGSIGLLLEHQKNLTGSSAIRSATMKGLLIHTADEAGITAGPDYTFGWGLLNTKNAALLMNEDKTNGLNFNIRELDLNQGVTILIPVYTNGIAPLAATICWTDPPPTVYTSYVNDPTPMLVNDLDLRLINPSQLATLPWKLDLNNPAAAATKGDNSVDNVEKVDAGTPSANQTWYVQIKHKGTLEGGSQAFSLIMSGITKPPFASTWTGTVSNDWYNPSNWDNGVPGSITNVTIPTGRTNYPTLISNAACNNIMIESGASLLDNGFLTVSGIFSMQSAIPGNAWHFISSPVSNAVSGMFLGKYLQQLTESTNLYTDIIPVSEALTPMKGFAVWGEDGFTATYAGSLNTGTKTFTTTYSGFGKGWNLVGNPYPSSIDWDASGWTKTNLNSAIYIENQGGWAIYNNGVGIPTNGGSRYIAPCQGFLVQATDNGLLGLTDAVRVHNGTNFFKNKAVVPYLVRLKLSGNGYSDETVVRVVPEATEMFDGQYDAVKLFGEQSGSAELYSKGDIEYAINAIPEAIPVQVGVHTDLSGKYSIVATEVNDFSDVTLFDKKTGNYCKLIQRPYDFDYATGEDEVRFTLYFRKPNSNESQGMPNDIFAFHKTVNIYTQETTGASAKIYNLEGQLVDQAELHAGMNSIRVSHTGIYLVKVTTKSHIQTRKVWVE